MLLLCALCVLCGLGFMVWNLLFARLYSSVLQTLNLHASYADFNGRRGGRDSLSPAQLGRTQNRFPTTTRRPLFIGWLRLCRAVFNPWQIEQVIYVRILTFD